MDDKELWRQWIQLGRKAVPSSLIDTIQKAQDAAPKWPKRIQFLLLALGLLSASAFFLFPDRFYISLGGMWLCGAVCAWNVRTYAPEFPEFGVFAWWFILFLMAVLIGYEIFHTNP